MRSFAPRASVAGLVPLAVEASAGSLAFRHRCIDTVAPGTEAAAAASLASATVGSGWRSSQDVARIICCWARRNAGLSYAYRRFGLADSWLADWERFLVDFGYPLGPLNH
jgi:hypothetical protein